MKILNLAIISAILFGLHFIERGELFMSLLCIIAMISCIIKKELLSYGKDCK